MAVSAEISATTSSTKASRTSRKNDFIKADYSCDDDSG
jgi:hypothetical protein